jgi:hypothetical protein
MTSQTIENQFSTSTLKEKSDWVSFTYFPENHVITFNQIQLPHFRFLYCLSFDTKQLDHHLIISNISITQLYCYSTLNRYVCPHLFLSHPTVQFLTFRDDTYSFIYFFFTLSFHLYWTTELMSMSFFFVLNFKSF